MTTTLTPAHDLDLDLAATTKDTPMTTTTPPDHHDVTGDDDRHVTGDGDPAVDPRAPDRPDPPGEGDRGDAPRLAARCADGNGTLTALFFSDHVADIARAKAMCGLCPLREPCLAGALAREEPWGVWGGELLSGGRIIANKRPCGRPPKRPRPEVVYDELGPVGVPA